MPNKLKEKIAVITGGSSGIGLATAKLFVDEGAYVFITGRQKEKLDEAVKLIGKNVTGIPGDVSNLSDLERLYSIIKNDKGCIDILFANAGIGEFSSLDEVKEEHFDKIFNINVKGLFFSVQKAVHLMNAGGSIILNASIVAAKGFENFSVYSASKAAVRSFARCWTAELNKHQIRVNAISPALVPLPSYRSSGEVNPHMQQFLENLIKDIPLGRTGKVEDIAKAVLFLASDDSSYITGIELAVDGGVAQI